MPQEGLEARSPLPELTIPLASTDLSVREAVLEHECEKMLRPALASRRIQKKESDLATRPPHGWAQHVPVYVGLGPIHSLRRSETLRELGVAQKVV